MPVSPQPSTLAPPETGASDQPRVSFGEALRFWFKLGCISFGGPAGQIAIMHAELVERRRWISERRFLHALNFCMVLPGPEALQLATYIGWLMHRRRGGLAAGLLFLGPSLLLLILLSWVFVAYGEWPLVAGVFHGLKPAVVALVVMALQRMASRVLKQPWAWAVAAAAFAGIQFGDLPFPLILGAAAAVGVLGGRYAPARFSTPAIAEDPVAAEDDAVLGDHSPTPAHARFTRAGTARVLATGIGLWALVMGLLAGLAGTAGALTQMGWFFTKAALLTFGGAYAVLPYVVQGAVEQHHWLNGSQMLAGLALGETTPGPLIIVVAFVGFLGGWGQQVLGPSALFLGGALAACVVAFFTFLPSFVFVMAFGPWVETTHQRLGITAPLKAISAAVVGVMLSLAWFFAGHVVWPNGTGQGLDVFAVVLAMGAWVALWRWKVGALPLLGGCALAGMALSAWPLGLH